MKNTFKFIAIAANFKRIKINTEKYSLVYKRMVRNRLPPTLPPPVKRDQRRKRQVNATYTHLTFKLCAIALLFNMCNSIVT